ncbi:hypothetical protein EPK99_23450 [Neorhizobium lilium]|uniref:Choline phosphatase n=1 Tax=Neorhizobium lilium TaxID=2503024 RepID=A0A444LB43_9HYPH|nr:hypothetical protein [Neorhizobium lilium]RWX74852.1 hypothetical protein EPK99_23450 [Neorhizobium lilium]
MKIYIPAWHYRARAIVQRTWGWSPIEEMILLAFDLEPGTIGDIAGRLRIPNQVARSTVARLMQFGLVELRVSPNPVLSTSPTGHEFIRTGRALPERVAEREMGISLVLEKVGHSVLRRKDVTIVPTNGFDHDGRVVAFPIGEQPETDETMAHRVSQFVSQSLRPGEWLRGVRTTGSVMEKKFLEIDLAAFKRGEIPEGASANLVAAVNETLKTAVLPRASKGEPSALISIETSFAFDQLIVGSPEHIERFERIARAAVSDIFVLSTFVLSLSDERGKVHRERIYTALEDAYRRGVRCHLFFGTSLDKAKHALAMEELHERLSAVKLSRGFLLVHRDSVGSHAKILAADDGQGGTVVVIGSCNWLSSPFSAVEVSVELREPIAVAAGLDILKGIAVSLASASRSVEILQFLASEARRARPPLSAGSDQTAAIKARLTVLHAQDHGPLLRKAAHTANERFVCITNRMGATVVPGLLNPAEVAGGRLKDVRIYYSRQSGPTKRKHMAAHRKRLEGTVEVIPVREPQVHAKFLIWDRNDVVVSTMNWGSQSGSEADPLDEVGLHLEAPGIATHLLGLFDESLKKVLEVSSNGGEELAPEIAGGQ